MKNLLLLDQWADRMADDLSFLRKKRIEEMLKRIATQKAKEQRPNIPLIDTANSKTFEEKVIRRSERLPVLVDFYADWCMPCNMLAPVIERVVSGLSGKAALVKINIDENPILASRFGVMSIPCVKLFRNRRIIAEFLGFMPEQRLKQWILNEINKA